MLTRKQLELLNFIRARLDAEGVPPSFDEMKDALGLRSKSGIHRLIVALEERGFIRRLPHRARAIEVLRLPGTAMEGGPAAVPAPAPAPARVASAAHAAAPAQAQQVAEVIRLHDRQPGVTELAVMGRIAAGVPIEAISEISHHVAVPDSLLSGRGAHFALEVRGDSMVEAGINDGDIVVIREQSTAENGDIVVALIADAEATLKRFRRRGEMIALEAANPAYKTRILPAHMIQVQGRLVGLIRSYS